VGSILRFVSVIFAVLALIMPGTAVADQTQETQINQGTVSSDVPDLTGTPWDGHKLKLPSGTKLIVTKGADGKPSYTLEFPGKVVWSNNGTLTFDKSGLGATECLWGIYVEIRNTLALCGKEEDASILKLMDDALDRINIFIIENSVIPDAKERLEVRIREKLLGLIAQSSRMTEDERKKMCNEGMADTFIKSLKAPQGIEKFKAEVDKFLSVPRPAAINPCL